MEITQTQQDTLDTAILFASSHLEVGGCLTEERQGECSSVCHP